MIPKNTKQFLSFSLIVFWVAFALMIFNHKQERKPASLLAAPKLITATPFTVTITPVGGIPHHDNQELTLRADVIFNVPVTDKNLHTPKGKYNLEWKWDLPKGTSIVSGEQNDVWPGLKPGEHAHTQISVLNVSKDTLKTVTFTVRAEAKNSSLNGAATFATRGIPDNLNSSLGRSASHR